MPRQDFSYEIVSELGVISEGNGSWKKELNRVSWSGKDAKYDIRDWSQGHEKMGKGVTLTEAELRKLKELIDAEIAYLDK